MPRGGERLRASTLPQGGDRVDRGGAPRRGPGGGQGEDDEAQRAEGVGHKVGGRHLEKERREQVRQRPGRRQTGAAGWGDEAQGGGEDLAEDRVPWRRPAP